ncbi:MAG: recombinase RecA, partial [Pirellulaceae bacterium]|nr:recombinase RecA [Pirellulaceae bacterium]
MADSNRRLSTGIARLDDLLGGGLLPGTLAAVVGSTGIGKT